MKFCEEKRGHFVAMPTIYPFFFYLNGPILFIVSVENLPPLPIYIFFRRNCVAVAALFPKSGDRRIGAKEINGECRQRERNRSRISSVRTRVLKGDALKGTPLLSAVSRSGCCIRRASATVRSLDRRITRVNRLIWSRLS